jgi:hypothetical protein
MVPKYRVRPTIAYATPSTANALSNLVASRASYPPCILQWVWVDCSVPTNKGEMNATKREPRKKDVVVEEDSENGELLLFSRSFRNTHRSLSSRQMHLATLCLNYTQCAGLFIIPLAALLQHSICGNISAGEIDSMSNLYVMSSKYD